MRDESKRVRDEKLHILTMKLNMCVISSCPELNKTSCITQTRIIVTLISLHFTSDHERVKGEAVSFVNVTVFPPIRFPDFVRSCRAFLPQAYATSPNANAAFSLTERLAAICVKWCGLIFKEIICKIAIISGTYSWIPLGYHSEARPLVGNKDVTRHSCGCANAIVRYTADNYMRKKHFIRSRSLQLFLKELCLREMRIRQKYSNVTWHSGHDDLISWGLTPRAQNKLHAKSIFCEIPSVCCV